MLNVVIYYICEHSHRLDKVSNGGWFTYNSRSTRYSGLVLIFRQNRFYTYSEFGVNFWTQDSTLWPVWPKDVPLGSLALLQLKCLSAVE